MQSDLSEGRAQDSLLKFLDGKSQMGRRIREFDWNSSHLGNPAYWPQNLRTCIHIMLVSNQPMCICWGRHEKMSFFNDACLNLIGPDYRSALGQPLKSAWKERLPGIDSNCEAVFTNGELIVDFQRIHYAGAADEIREEYFELLYHPIIGENGIVEGVLCIFLAKELLHIEKNEQTANPSLIASVTPSLIEGTTQHRFNQKGAKTVESNETEKRFQHLIQHNIIGVLFWDLDKGLVDANDTLLKLLGYTRQEFISGVHWNAITPPEWRAADKQGEQDVRDFGYHIPFEKQYLHKDGHPVDVIIGSTAFENTSNKQGVTFVLDISERKSAESDLRKSEALFRQFSDNIQNLAWMADGEGWIYWYNQQWYDYTGTTLEDMQGNGWVKVHHPDHIERVLDFLKHGWQTNQSFELTFPLRGADGVYRWFLTRAVPISNEAGNIIRWIGTNTNVDEQVKARETLFQSQKELQQIFRQAPVSMVVYKGEDLVVEVASEAALSLWGKTEDQVIGRKFFDISPELREGQQSLFAEVWRTGQPFAAKEFPVQYNRSGKLHFIYYDFIFQPIRNDDGSMMGIVSIGNDVTHSVLARKKVEESETHFRMLAESLPQLVWMTDSKGKQLYASQKWEQLTGVDPRDQDSWAEIVNPQDLRRIQEIWAESLAIGKAYKVEVRLRGKGGDFRWFYGTGAPVKDEAGEIVRWIGAFTDIHEQKMHEQALSRLVNDRTIEVQNANKELQRSNEDLQQFAHVASHDLKEPVRKVMMFSNRLKEEFATSLPEKAIAYLEKMNAACRRMYAMIDGVLRYSSLNAVSIETELVNLNEIIASVQTDLEVIMTEKNAQINFTSLPTIEGSEILLHQLFYNLVNNSLKFSKIGVPPEITIKAKLEAAQSSTNEISPTSRNWWKISLSDNGIGFSNDDVNKIFETFSRLHGKNEYEGTGLGLSLCKRIVERHGGLLTAEAVEGNGATFYIRLPEIQL
jgi:PAS domain S-box-containing protein